MLEERLEELEKKLDKKIKHIQALAKRVVKFMRKERDEKEEASKNETTKYMVAR
jgi:phage host-nuclease inhibitor protein Gam